MAGLGVRWLVGGDVSMLGEGLLDGGLLGDGGEGLLLLGWFADMAIVFI